MKYFLSGVTESMAVTLQVAGFLVLTSIVLLLWALLPRQATFLDAVVSQEGHWAIERKVLYFGRNLDLDSHRFGQLKKLETKVIVTTPKGAKVTTYLKGEQSIKSVAIEAEGILLAIDGMFEFGSLRANGCHLFRTLKLSEKENPMWAPPTEQMAGLSWRSLRETRDGLWIYPFWKTVNGNVATATSFNLLTSAPACD